MSATAPCPYAREDCTGKHGHKYPRAELCPGALARSRQTINAWHKALRGREHECGMKDCTRTAYQFTTGHYSELCWLHIIVARFQHYTRKLETQWQRDM